MKHDDIDKRFNCPACGAVNSRPVVEETPHLPHFGKASCMHCGRFVDWVAKSDSDSSKYRRPKQHRNLVKKFGRGFCELCLVTQDGLPINQVLEAHHVIEYQDTQDSRKENIWILCTSCSRLVHWRRYYNDRPMHVFRR